MSQLVISSMISSKPLNHARMKQVTIFMSESMNHSLSVLVQNIDL